MNIETMKQLKAERGYSNEQISRLSGIPVSTIQKIFSGTTTAPRYDTLSALEKVFREPSMYVRETMAHYTTKKQGEFTLEDYYAIPDEQRVELIDGVIYDMGAPSVIHQLIIPAVFSVLHSYIRTNKGGCIPMMAPTDVRLDCDNRTMVQPDILIVCDRSKLTKLYIEGAPDFVIEVLSPSTRRKDLLLKAHKYQNAGVREYWLIDPDKKRIITYIFQGDDDDIFPVIYTFEDKVPVAVFDNRCVVDFAEIYEEIGFMYEIED